MSNFIEDLFGIKDKAAVFEEAARIKAGGKPNLLGNQDADMIAITAMGATMEAPTMFLVQAALIPMMELLVRGGEDEEMLGKLVEAVVGIHVFKHSDPPVPDEDMPQMYKDWKEYREAYEFFTEATASIDEVEVADGLPDES